MSIEPGSRVGPYEIIAVLGAGGMGVVYRARDPQLGRELAIKVLPENSGENPEQLRRFEQEARSASLLNHPAVVTIYDVGRAGGQRYIAMELVEGETLRSLLAAGPLAHRQALAMAIKIADGLGAAHERGIVHRDLKPENLMITSGGNVKILDFGLARLVHPEISPDEVTAQQLGPNTTPGAILGTVSYMSPEQASGRPAGFASDQFSLGVILYEMLAGSRPFQRAGTIETLHAIILEEAPPVGQLNPSVPERLTSLVARLLCKHPEGRYASTRDLVLDLQSIHDSASSGVSGQSRPASRFSPRTRGSIAAGLAAVMLAGAVGLYLRDREPRPPLPAVKSLAVLPFTDLSGDLGGQLYSRGISETISARLASLRDLRIMPPSASARSGSETDLAKLGRDLGATMILNGSVQRIGDDLRVNYSLIDAANGVQLAAASVPGSASDLFLLQDQLADAVVQALELQTTPPRSRDRAGFVTVADQDRYVEALGFLQRYESEESVDHGIALLERLAANVKDSALVHAALGRAYLYKFKLSSDEKWMTRAVAACERAVRLDPERADIHVTLGELHIASGRFDQAIEVFQSALRQQPNSGDATLGLAQAYHRAGRIPETERTYRRAIALMPNWWAGYNRLGAFYMSQGRFAEAVPQFQRVIELTPDNTRGYNNLGAAYQQLGNAREAQKMFNRSLAITPNSDALANLGFLLYFQSNYAEAARVYERATALNPNDHLLWLNLGDSYRWASGGKDRSRAAYERAIKLADTALRLNPSDATAHVTRALASAKCERIDEAKKSIESALAIDSDDAVSLFSAAMVENLAGNPRESVALLARAVEKGLPLDQIREDPEFANLKSRKDFQSLEQARKAAPTE